MRVFYIMLTRPLFGVPPAARYANMSALLLSAGSLTLRTHTNTDTHAKQAHCGMLIRTVFDTWKRTRRSPQQAWKCSCMNVRIKDGVVLIRADQRLLMRWTSFANSCLCSHGAPWDFIWSPVQWVKCYLSSCLQGTSSNERFGGQRLLWHFGPLLNNFVSKRSKVNFHCDIIIVCKYCSGPLFNAVTQEQQREWWLVPVNFCLHPLLWTMSGSFSKLCCVHQQVAVFVCLPFGAEQVLCTLGQCIVAL